MPNFVTNCVDQIFKIKTKHLDDGDERNERLCLRSEEGQLEISVNPNGYIRYIECFLERTIDYEIFLDSDLPDCRTMDEDDLPEYDIIGLSYEQHVDMRFKRYFFTLNFTKKNEFLIWIYSIRSMREIPSSYVKDGRVEYYYDENCNLMYIKVVDLTEQECNYLKWFCFNNILNS